MTKTKMTKMSKMKDLFAFWRYDFFPYVLGGPVDAMDEKGNVQTTNYGYGRWFRPIKLVPLVAGKELLAKLEVLRTEHLEAKRKLDEEWRAKIAALMPEVDRKD